MSIKCENIASRDPLRILGSRVSRKSPKQIRLLFNLLHVLLGFDSLLTVEVMGGWEWAAAPGLCICKEVRVLGKELGLLLL